MRRCTRLAKEEEGKKHTSNDTGTPESLSTPEPRPPRPSLGPVQSSAPTPSAAETLFPPSILIPKVPPGQGSPNGQVAGASQDVLDEVIKSVEAEEGERRCNTDPVSHDLNQSSGGRTIETDA